MNHITYQLAAIALCSACGSSNQTTYRGRSENRGSTVDQATGRTEVLVKKPEVRTLATSDSGTIQGAEIGLPPNAVATTGTLSIDVVNAPTSFSPIDADWVGSVPIAITSDVSDQTLAQPMVLAIPYSLNILPLTADPSRTVENLCVIADIATTDDEILWRNEAIKVDEAKSLVYLETRAFGIYQVFFCGDESLPTLVDAETAGMTDEVIDLSVLAPDPEAEDTAQE